MSHNDRYILDGKNPVACPNLYEWGKWFENADNRKVCQSIVGKVGISTVFLGLDHRFHSEGPPILFETMIFGGAHDGYCERNETWDEAVEAHDRAMQIVRKSS